MCSVISKGSGDATVDTILGRTGLTRHEAAFHAQGITAATLGGLTDAIMQELGLTVSERNILRAELERIPVR